MKVEPMEPQVAFGSHEIEHTLPEHMRPGDRLEAAKEAVNRLLPSLSKWQLEELTTDIRRVYVNKYHRRRVPKYGQLDKGFDDEKINRFFKAVDDDRFLLLWRYQALLGLRVGEACKLNIADINLQSRELQLRSEKSKNLCVLRIPEALFNETIRYIRFYKGQIERAHGYLFFPDFSKQGYHRGKPYVETNYTRNRFRHYIKKAGLDDDVYDVSEESVANRTPRRLHLLSTHSLRHYAITRMARATNGNLVLTSRFARHASPSTTMIYISQNKRELYEAIDAVAIADVAAVKRMVVK